MSSSVLRPFVAVCVFLVALLISGAGACSTPGDDEPTGDVVGAIVALAGLFPNSNAGSLLAYDTTRFGVRSLDTNVNLVSLPFVAPGGELLPYGTSDAYGVTRMVDVYSGESSPFGEARGPIASSRNVAFCRGKQLLVAPLENYDATVPIRTVTPTQCVRGVWRGDAFAFITLETPRGAGGGATLYVWENGSLRPPVFVDVSVIGIGPLSWSAGGTSLIYSVDDKIVLISLEGGISRIVGSGSSARFSPVNNDVYSAVTAQGTVEVREVSGRVISVLDPSSAAQDGSAAGVGPSEVGTAWSPDGDAVAVVTPRCLGVWYTKTGEFSCEALPPKDRVFEPVALWVRPRS